MARVVFERDVDDNYMIESAIRKTLSSNISAEVPAAIIAERYTLRPDGDPSVGTLEEKCAAIARGVDLDLETFVSGDLAVFKPNDPRKPDA